MAVIVKKIPEKQVFSSTIYMLGIVLDNGGSSASRAVRAYERLTRRGARHSSFRVQRRDLSPQNSAELGNALVDREGQARHHGVGGWQRGQSIQPGLEVKTESS